MLSKVKTKGLWILPVLMLALVTAATVLLLRMRGEVATVAAKSLPAVRLASLLEDRSYDIQNRLLVGIIRTGTGPGTADAASIRGSLKESEDFLGEYASTVLHGTDRGNHANAARGFSAYKQEVLRFLDDPGRVRGRAEIEDVINRYSEYDHTLDVMRDYRQARASEWVASSLRTGTAAFHVQLTFLFVTLVGIAGIAILVLVRGIRDPHPDDF